MKNRCSIGYFLIFCWMLVGGLTAAGQGYPAKDRLTQADGPYLLYGTEGLRLIRVDTGGILKDSLIRDVSGFSFPVESRKGDIRFRVKLHALERPAWKMSQAEKLLVISDPHGDLESFVSVLQGNNVIGKAYEWTFGPNQLVIIGDVFDRGEDVLPIFWLIYKLEQEAAAAGGSVVFMLGNHEEMVLRGDCRYTKEKYKKLAEEAGISYPDLWGEHSELGRWLRTRNLLQIIGDNLLVHAGLSPDFLKRKESLPQMNQTASEGLSLSKQQRKEASPLSEFIFGSSGPFWYRGMVRSADHYHPLPVKDLLRLLKKYRVKRIVVGHTIFDDITTFYNKRVIAVNVENRKNREKGRGRGILIEKDKGYIVYDTRPPKPFIP